MPSLIVILLLADLVVAVAYPLAWRVGDTLWRLTALVDPQSGANFTAWYLSVKLFLLASGLGVYAYRRVDLRAVGSWCLMALPPVFLALSFDAIAHLHDLLQQRSDRFLLRLLGTATPVFYTRLWMLVLGIPLVALILALGYCGRRNIPWQFRRRYALGLLLTVACAAVIEPEVIPLRGVWYVLAVSASQLGELLGVTVMIWAVYELLQSPRGALHL